MRRFLAASLLVSMTACAHMEAVEPRPLPPTPEAAEGRVVDAVPSPMAVQLVLFGLQLLSALGN